MPDDPAASASPISGPADPPAVGPSTDPAGDPGSVQAHADLVYATCRRILGNDQDAADAAQEVFVAWLRGGARIRGNVGAWLHGTAVRRCLDLRRRQHRRLANEDAAARLPPPQGPDHRLQAVVDEALNALDAPSRALLLEHHVLGRTQDELAVRFRTTQSTISRRLAKAAEALKSALHRRGITAAVGVVGAVLAAPANASCPPLLTAPLLAQAQVAGSAALTGAATMKLPALGGWGVALLKIGGWSAAALLALTVGTAVVVWNAYPLPPVPDISAHLPKPIRTLDGPWPAIRYPSIEAVIAGMEPVDPLRQERLAELTRESVPDELYRVLRQAIEAVPDASNPVALAAEQALAPLEELLMEGPLRFDGGGWLEVNYRAGRCSPERLTALFPTFPNQGSWRWLRSAEYRFEVVLRHRHTPRHVEAWLRWCSSLRRNTPTFLIDNMSAIAVTTMQDRFITDADIQHRVPADLRQSWLVLPRRPATRTADCMATEAAILLIPSLEDLSAGRPVAMEGLSGGNARAWWTWEGWAVRLGQARILQMTYEAELAAIEGRTASEPVYLEANFHNLVFNGHEQRIAELGAQVAMIMRADPSLDPDQALRRAGADPADPTLPRFTVERTTAGTLNLVPATDPATVDRLGTVGTRMKGRLAKPNDRYLRWPVVRAPAAPAVSTDPEDEPIAPQSRF